MVKFVNGDIWKCPCHIRVITVNCVSIMGKGIALEYKQRHPEGYTRYLDACRNGFFQPGSLLTERRSEGSHWLLATKDHWKDPSQYEWIELGLWEMRKNLIKAFSSQTVAIPALGCGNGGLNYLKVVDSMRALLGYLDHNIYVFNPVGFENINIEAP